MKNYKLITTLLCVLGSLDSNSMEARITRLQKTKEVIQAPVITKTSSLKKGVNDEAINRVMEQGKRIEALLKRRSAIPIIWEKRKTFKTGTTVRGTLLNSIVSSNLESPVLIEAHANQGLSTGTLFSCKAITKNKRVLTLCNKLIKRNGEHKINAQALNLDGSSGLVGEYNDQKETMIEGALVSEFTSGMINAAGSKISTPYGLVSAGEKSSEILIGEGKNLEPIITVQAGTEVLVYFMEALNESV